MPSPDSVLPTASQRSADTRPRQLSKRPHVPLLIESFPHPPSFIPPSLGSSRPSSTASLNPPPSLPPSSPLPPVPGPSPLSDQETLLLLTSTRSHRSARLSGRSSPHGSNRDSIVSTGSGRDGSPPCSPNVARRRDSVASVRSTLSLLVPAQGYRRSPPYGKPPLQ
jgi:large subunit ribosomal protein LP1